MVQASIEQRELLDELEAVGVKVELVNYGNVEVFHPKCKRRFVIENERRYAEAVLEPLTDHTLGHKEMDGKAICLKLRGTC